MADKKLKRAEVSALFYLLRGDFLAKRKTCCEECAYFAYDEEYESYFCEINLDEDEMLRFMEGAFDNCPYYRSGDEYEIVRKQN